MTKLILVSAQQLERLLLTVGFERIRQKGSHVFYRHPDGRTTTIPHHSGADLPRPLLRIILREIQMSVDEYNVLLRD